MQFLPGQKIKRIFIEILTKFQFSIFGKIFVPWMLIPQFWDPILPRNLVDLSHYRDFEQLRSFPRFAFFPSLSSTPQREAPMRQLPHSGGLPHFVNLSNWWLWGETWVFWEGANWLEFLLAAISDCRVNHIYMAFRAAATPST